MSSAVLALSPSASRQDGQRVRGASWWRVELPLATALRHATADTVVLEAVVLRLDLGDAVGWAEVRSNGEYATHESADAIETALASVVVGETVETVTGALLLRSRLAAMAVDVAALDALGKREGLPLHRLLSGGTGEGVPRALRTHAPIGFGSVSEAEDRARRHVVDGFRRVKVRVGASDVAADLDRVRAIRAVVGPDVDVVTDANGAWDVDQALVALPALAAEGVSWLEQPVASVDDLRDVTASARRLRRDIGASLSIRADESVTDARSVPRLRRAVDGVHLKLEKVGTIARLKAAIEVALANDLVVALGQMDQGRLGCAATVHVAAGLGLRDAELWGCAEVARDVAGPLTLTDGCVLVPTGPGLGVNVELTCPPRGTL